MNPHAGEQGLLGKEEINIIEPAIKSLKKMGLKVDGPVPADTAFIDKFIKKYDVIHTMYHDQGLPVIKFNDFSHTTNVTLGLPIIRVSVDHGTATELVGTGDVNIASFVQSLKVAERYFKKCNIKRLGQHFLVDQNIIDKLVNHIKPLKSEKFLEIGPGDGALTKSVINRINKLTLVEKDSNLIEKSI